MAVLIYFFRSFALLEKVKVLQPPCYQFEHPKTEKQWAKNWALKDLK